MMVGGRRQKENQAVVKMRSRARTGGKCNVRDVLGQLKTGNSYSIFFFLFCDSGYSELLFGESLLPLAPTLRSSAPALIVPMALLGLLSPVLPSLPSLRP